MLLRYHAGSGFGGDDDEAVMAVANRLGRHSRGGFTLPELLVVIGILALLMGIVIPYVIHVRRSAACASCMSNVRQLSNAVIHYSTDWAGQIPYCNWGPPDVPSSGTYGHGWLYSAVDLRTNYPASSDLNGPWGGTPPADGVKTGVIWPYVNNMRAYHCPIEDPAFLFGTEFMTSYLMNAAQCGYGRLGPPPNNNNPGVNINRFASPSQAVMFWEALEQQFMGQQNTGAVWNDGSSYPFEEVLANRHSRGAIISCYDGHVEWWDPTTWQTWVNAPGLGRLWCDPLSPDGR